MTVNNRTSSRNYAKPNAANLLSEDVVRLSEALDSIDTDVAALQSRAPAASPTLTGTPIAPTPAVDTNTTQVATTAFVLGQTSAANPAINGTAAAGSSSRYARADHVHPIDTSRAPVESPSFTGTPAAPTPAADTNTTQLATTAYVVGQNYTKQTRTVFAGAGLTGGGDLTANRTIAADIATQAEAEVGTSSTKLMTPERTTQAIASDLATQAEAEAGTNSAKLMTPQRVTQAITAMAGNVVVETFTTSGTFTKHVEDLSYIIYCVAGGGGGGKLGTQALYQGTGGTGGGGGAGNYQHLPAALVGATETVTVGAGGLGATSAAGALGGDGGNSSFGNLVHAYGGLGGRYPGNAQVNPTGGRAGGVIGPSSAGGDKTTSIYGGGHGNSTSAVSAYYGAGGGTSTNLLSIFAGNGGAEGLAGAAPGGGGGGSGTVSTTQNGGNGGNGRITIYRIKRQRP